jgi:hypothetical protein
LKSSYKNIIFVDENRIYRQNTIDKCDLILSPFYYWSKIEQLPIKSIREVLRVASSLFDGLLPSGEYRYKVDKLEEGKFLIIAYDIAFIKSKLVEFGIKLENIDSFYFAQSELKSITEPILLNEKEALVVIDEVVQKIDSRYIRNSIDFVDILNNIRLSKNKISSVELQNSIIDSKTLYTVVAILSIFTTLYITEFVLYKKELSNILSSQNALYDKYDLPSTSFELDSIKSKFLTIDNEQFEFRDKLKYLFNLRVFSGEGFLNLNIKNQDINFKFKLIKTTRAEEIKSYLIKEFKIKDMKVVDNILEVKMKI